MSNEHLPDLPGLHTPSRRGGDVLKNMGLLGTPLGINEPIGATDSKMLNATLSNLASIKPQTAESKKRSNKTPSLIQKSQRQSIDSKPPSLTGLSPKSSNPSLKKKVIIPPSSY